MRFHHHPKNGPLAPGAASESAATPQPPLIDPSQNELHALARQIERACWETMIRREGLSKADSWPVMTTDGKDVLKTDFGIKTLREEDQ